MYLDVEFIVQMLCEVLGTIDGTVLATGATESNLQVGKIAFDKPRGVMIHQGINGVYERQYLAVVLKKIDDGLVEAREGLILLVLAGVVGAATVEDITASVTTFVNGKTLLIRE